MELLSTFGQSFDIFNYLIGPIAHDSCEKCTHKKVISSSSPKDINSNKNKKAEKSAFI